VSRELAKVSLLRKIKICEGGLTLTLFVNLPPICAQPNGKVGQAPFYHNVQTIKTSSNKVNVFKHVPLAVPFQWAPNAPTLQLNTPPNEFGVNCSIFHNIPANLSQGVKQYTSNSAHLMKRFVRGLTIYIYQLFSLADLIAQFPTRATRGTGVVGTSTYPSIPNTNTVNVMRPKRPSWTSPLTEANRPRLFTTCSVSPSVRHAGFYSHAFQIHRPCMRRELPCSIYSHTRKPNHAH
jgi:hypothetical protein